MTTSTDIANMALALFDEMPIDAITDNNKPARLCNRHYATTYKAELSARQWKFAVVTAELTGTDTDSGAGTLNWEYELPTDPAVLRVLPLTYDNTLYGVPISYELLEGKLYSDQSSPRSIRYIADIDDPTDWPVLFQEVVATALGVKIAHALTHKQGMIQIAQQAYERALFRSSSLLDDSGRLYDASWAFQRGDTRYWRA